MCTSARLVQAGRESAWFGMPMQGTPPPANVRLRPGEPAYLEVRIDPAAHGEAGLGRIQREVLLRTASHQDLRFELTATVLR